MFWNLVSLTFLPTFLTSNSMKIKQLIKLLQMHDPDSEVIVQDYNWNEYEFTTAAGGKGEMVLFVSPVNEEEK